MNNREKYRSSRSIALPAAFPRLAYASPASPRHAEPRLTRRVARIIDRREIKVVERESAQGFAALFQSAQKPRERVRTWSSEQIAEIEETYE